MKIKIDIKLPDLKDYGKETLRYVKSFKSLLNSDPDISYAFDVSDNIGTVWVHFKIFDGKEFHSVGSASFYSDHCLSSEDLSNSLHDINFLSEIIHPCHIVSEEMEFEFNDSLSISPRSFDVPVKAIIYMAIVNYYGESKIESFEKKCRHVVNGIVKGEKLAQEIKNLRAKYERSCIERIFKSEFLELSEKEIFNIMEEIKASRLLAE